MKRAIALILACICLATLLCACGASNPNAGTYKGVYGKWVGSDESGKEDITANTLELKGDGTGVHNRDDLELKITWSADGESFKMTEKFLGLEIEYTGTIKDGEIHMYNGDPADDLTYEYVYKK